VMKRIWLKNGESWPSEGSLDTEGLAVRFVDSAGQQHTLAGGSTHSQPRGKCRHGSGTT
jgi:hypothetical protein